MNQQQRKRIIRTMATRQPFVVNSGGISKLIQESAVQSSPALTNPINTSLLNVRKGDMLVLACFSDATPTAQPVVSDNNGTVYQYVDGHTVTQQWWIAYGRALANGTYNFSCLWATAPGRGTIVACEVQQVSALDQFAKIIAQTGTPQSLSITPKKGAWVFACSSWAATPTIVNPWTGPLIALPSFAIGVNTRAGGAASLNGDGVSGALITQTASPPATDTLETFFLMSFK